MRRTLVVYYSWSNGNTERVAERLAEACGADIERIETAEPYPDDYETTVAQAKREVEEGYEPPIEPLGHDPADYDVVAVGTPTWWYTMAPAVSTFLSTHDLSGRLVVPFMTNGGWPGSVIEDMGEAASGATVVEPMEVRFDSSGGARLVTPEGEIDRWVGRVAALAR